MKKAILIQGAPGVGKTTLARQLARDLDVKCIVKDDIKECLFDSLGPPADRAESAVYGRIAVHTLFNGLAEFVRAKQVVIIESNFVPKYALADLAKIIDTSNLLQLHVYCDPVVQEARFFARSKNGSRNDAHFDELEDVRGTLERHGAIDGIETIRVDTTNFKDDNYHQLLKKVQLICKGAVL